MSPTRMRHPANLSVTAGDLFSGHILKSRAGAQRLHPPFQTTDETAVTCPAWHGAHPLQSSRGHGRSKQWGRGDSLYCPWNDRINQVCKNVYWLCFKNVAKKEVGVEEKKTQKNVRTGLDFAVNSSKQRLCFTCLLTMVTMSICVYIYVYIWEGHLYAPSMHLLMSVHIWIYTLVCTSILLPHSLLRESGFALHVCFWI